FRGETPQGRSYNSNVLFKCFYTCLILLGSFISFISGRKMSEVEDVGELREMLRKSEDEKASILTMAKQLLDRDKEKDERLSLLSEDNLQKAKEVKHLEALLKCRDKDLEECENDMNDLRKEIDEAKNRRRAYVSDLEKRMSDLREQLSVKSSELCAVEGEKARVEKRLAEKDRELEEVLKKGFCEETANATTDSIMDAEIARLTHKTEALEQELAKAGDNIEGMRRELIEKSRELENEQARCEEINAICNEYKRDAEGMRSRNAELTAELEDHRNNIKVAKKGNSMFAEFVDERLKLEKDLIKLKSENDWLRAEKRNLDRELECMRQQLILALALPSTNGGDVSALQSEISRLRAELDLTKEKLANVNKETPVLVGRSTEYSGKVFSDVVVRTMSEENARLGQKIVDLQRERSELFDQCTESGCRLANEARRRKELEAEVKSLRMQLEIARTSNRPKLATQAKECLVERVVRMQDYLNPGESLLTMNESTKLHEDEAEASRAKSSSQITEVTAKSVSHCDEDTVDADSERITQNDENRPMREVFDEQDRLHNGDVRSVSPHMTPLSETRSVLSLSGSSMKRTPSPLRGVIPKKRTRRVKFADEDAMKSFNETADSMASSVFSSMSTIADCNMSRKLTRRRRKVIQNVRDV
uniref:Uncharacterized protein n=1 Tax=Parascaris univalens TaxID=6257 RepID=A0A914ZMY9_PARUN